MEKSNHDKDKNLNYNLDSSESSTGFNLLNNLPNWLQDFVKLPTVYNFYDINEGIIDGYPIDDDF